MYDSNYDVDEDSLLEAQDLWQDSEATESGFVNVGLGSKLNIRGATRKSWCVKSDIHEVNIDMNEQ